MKHATKIGMKMVAGSALVLALGAGASAQTTGRGLPRHGQELFQGSLENDIRPGLLHLQVRLREHDGIVPEAFAPAMEDFGVSLILSGGLAASPAAIEVGFLTTSLVDRDHGVAGGAVISGFFGQNGEFVVELPPSLDVRGLGARGAQLPGRMATVVVDLGEAAQEAFATWQGLGSVAKPNSAGRAGGGQVLQLPTRGAGSAAKGQINHKPATRTVDLTPERSNAVSVSWEALGSVAKPKSAGSAGGGQVLQFPTSGAGSAARAQINHKPATRTVDPRQNDNGTAGDAISTEKLDDIANPDKVGSSDKKQLRRPSRRGGHVG